MYKFIDTNLKDNIGKIKINRPDDTNKLNIEAMLEMISAFKLFENNPECKVIVLESTGEYFCNGGELGDFRRKSPDDIRKFGDSFINLHYCIHNLSKIVIAKVRGKVMGGGYSLLEVCDLAIASENSLFGIPEMSNGLAPMMCLTGVLRTVTRKRAMELCMTAEPISAKKALDLGIVNFVCKDEELDSTVIKYAKKVIFNNPTAVALTKKLYTEAESLQYVNQMQRGLDILVSMLLSPNSLEVLNAKEQNRKPIYKY